jgi:hypothetical protein
MTNEISRGCLKKMLVSSGNFAIEFLILKTGNPCYYQPDMAGLPLDQMNWLEAVEFCRK